MCATHRHEESSAHWAQRLTLEAKKAAAPGGLGGRSAGPAPQQRLRLRWRWAQTTLCTLTLYIPKRSEGPTKRLCSVRRRLLRTLTLVA